MGPEVERLADEIIRLRTLVRAAYEEGFGDSRATVCVSEGWRASATNIELQQRPGTKTDW